MLFRSISLNQLSRRREPRPPASAVVSGRLVLRSCGPTKRSYCNVSSTTCFSLVSLSSTIFPRIIFSLSRFFRIFDLFFAEAQQATQVGIKIDDIFFAKLIKLKQVIELTLNYLSQLIIYLHSAFTVLPPFFLYLTIGS